MPPPRAIFCGHLISRRPGQTAAGCLNGERGGDFSALHRRLLAFGDFLKLRFELRQLGGIQAQRAGTESQFIRQNSCRDPFSLRGQLTLDFTVDIRPS